MAMATLFAAEAFALANRPETRVRIHSWVKTAPLFGDEASGERSYQREERHEHDEEVAAA